MSNQCPTCGGYLYGRPSNHVCPPMFECRFDEQWKDDRDWRETYARDAESAAEKFAEEYDCENEYNILRQGERCEQVIEVRSTDGTITRWNIHAESLPHYYANEADEIGPVAVTAGEGEVKP